MKSNVSPDPDWSMSTKENNDFILINILEIFRCGEQCLSTLSFIHLQQYIPSHDNVAPHESWGMEELGKYPK